VNSTELTRNYSDAELIERLTPLAASGGSAKSAKVALEKKGIRISLTELARIKEEHSTLYMALANDYSQQIEERLAQEYRESALAGTRLARTYVEKMQDDLDENGLGDNPEKGLTAAVKLMQTATDKLLTITGRPVGGQAIDPHEAARELVRLGVYKMADAESTAEDVTEDGVADGE
jgi:hypothetical protein